ncbi:MAG TPA: hypothetical protein DFS52_28700, partial [Myxococcales bacterium]|nr:hypothetical protein [Myxococcales bacterium]
VIKRHREELQRLAAQLLSSEVGDSEVLESILGPKSVAPLDLLAPREGEEREVRPSEPYNVPAH